MAGQTGRMRVIRNGEAVQELLQQWQQFREWLRTKNGKRAKIIAALLLALYLMTSAFAGDPVSFPGEPVPEIDPSSVANALTLLIGALLTHRAGRHRPRQTTR